VSEAVRAGSTRERLRAVGALWLCWLAVYLASELVLTVLAHRGQGLAERLGRVADSTVAAVSMPLLHGLGAADVPLTVQIGLVNALGLLLCFAIMPLLRSGGDPKPRGRFAERLDRLMWTHPALKWTNYVAYLFWPVPTFRRTPTLRLKSVCAFGVLPFLLPVLLGLQAGFAGSGFLEARLQHPIAVVFVGLALVLPHGLIELTALFVPIAALLEYYRAVRPLLVAGDVDGVSAALAQHGSWKIVVRWLPACLVAIALAAAIEANLTLSFAEALGQALGVGHVGY